MKHSVLAAVQGPFQESIDRLVEFSGVSMPKRSLEEILPDAAQDLDAFHAHRSLPSESISILVAAVDAKRIPMVKPEGAKRTPRLSKGQKANRKRMAAVAAVFTRALRVRTPEEVVESLFRSGSAPASAQPAPARPENKRVWASLVKGKAAVIRCLMALSHPEGPATASSTRTMDRRPKVATPIAIRPRVAEWERLRAEARWAAAQNTYHRLQQQASRPSGIARSYRLRHPSKLTHSISVV